MDVINGLCVTDFTTAGHIATLNPTWSLHDCDFTDLQITANECTNQVASQPVENRPGVATFQAASPFNAPGQTQTAASLPSFEAQEGLNTTVTNSFSFDEEKRAQYVKGTLK